MKPKHPNQKAMPHAFIAAHSESHAVHDLRTTPFRCPDETTFDAYRQRMLSAFEMSAIKFHIMACSECHNRRESFLKPPNTPAPNAALPPASEISAAFDCRDNELPGVVIEPPIISTLRSGEDHDWGEISLSLRAKDSPGLLADCTSPYAGNGLYVTKLFFTVCDDAEHCHLMMDAQGTWDKIVEIENYDHKVSLRKPPTKVITNPHLFAFAVQMDEDKGIAATVAEIVSKKRGVNHWMDADGSLVPCGAIVSVVGESVELPTPETPTQYFVMQGLVAAYDRCVQEEIIRDLLTFFRRERAIKWLLGNFGQSELPTHFLLVTSSEATERPAVPMEN